MRVRAYPIHIAATAFRDTELLTANYLEDARKTLLAIEDAESLGKILVQHANVHERCVAEAEKFAHLGADHWPLTAQAIHSLYAQVSPSFAGTSARQIINAAETLSGRLARFDSSGGSKQVRQLLEAYTSNLDVFLATHGNAQAAVLVRSAYELLNRLMCYVVDLEKSVEKLSDAPVEGDEESISLTLDGDYSLDQLIDKLDALRAMYVLLAGLMREFGLPEPNYRIRKIETGSIWLETIASKLGITLFKNAINAGVGFAYRNWTDEGKLKYRQPAVAAALKEAIKVRTLMEKAGISTEAVDPEISRCATNFVLELDRLAGPNNIRVDNQVPPSGDPLQLPQVGSPLKLPFEPKQ